MVGSMSIILLFKGKTMKVCLDIIKQKLLIRFYRHDWISSDAEMKFKHITEKYTLIEENQLTVNTHSN